MPSELGALGERQYGLVTRRQALEVWTPSTLDRRRRDGSLLNVAPGVYRLAGSPRSWRQWALAACLEAGQLVAVSGLAAGYLWQVDGVDRPDLQVSVPPGRHPGSSLARLRRQLLPPPDVGERSGVPVTTPARTIVDLSLLLPGGRLQAAADDLVRRRLLSLAELVQRLNQPLPLCDRSALAQVAQRLKTRGVGESAREDWVADTLMAAGLPPPKRNVRMVIDGRLREIDCSYPEWQVAIEYDGWEVHGDRDHFDDDRLKIVDLELMGWIVVPVTSAWTELRLVDRIRKAIALQAGHPRVPPAS